MTSIRKRVTLVAAVLVLTMGAILAIAETVQVEVVKNGEQTVTVETDGVVETLRLDDFADGEERILGSGDHTVTIRREGEELVVDDERIKRLMGGDGVWITGDGEVQELESPGGHAIFITRSGDGEDAKTVRRKVVIVRDEDGGAGVEVEHKAEAFVVGDSDGKLKVRVLSDGAFGFVGRPDRVVYRCAESDSILTVAKDDALLDSYIDPATGCLMEKVEPSEHGGMSWVMETTEDEE